MDRDQASASPVRFRADVGFQVPGEVPSRSRFPAPSERTGSLIAPVSDEQRACCVIVGLRLLLPGSGGASFGRTDARGVPTPSYPNEPWRDAGHIRAQALLDRPPTDRLAEKSLNCAVDVARSHRLTPIREHVDDRVQNPVMPAVSKSDRRTRLRGVAATRAIVAPHGVRARVRAAFQQSFQGP